jgi:hypothetical protein
VAAAKSKKAMATSQKAMPVTPGIVTTVAKMPNTPRITAMIQTTCLGGLNVMIFSFSPCDQSSSHLNDHIKTINLLIKHRKFAGDTQVWMAGWKITSTGSG